MVDPRLQFHFSSPHITPVRLIPLAVIFAFFICSLPTPALVHAPHHCFHEAFARSFASPWLCITRRATIRLILPIRSCTTPPVCSVHLAPLSQVPPSRSAHLPLSSFSSRTAPHRTAPWRMQIGKLVSLTDFVVYMNQLTGPIPPEVGELATCRTMLAVKWGAVGRGRCVMWTEGLG